MDKGKELANDRADTNKDQEEGEIKEGPHTKHNRGEFVGLALHTINKYRTIYFKGVDVDQVNNVLDDLKGIDIHYEVGQVMHNRFTKTMSVVLTAMDMDRVTKAHQLVEQCYSRPSKFSPEHTFNEKEVNQAAMAIHTVKKEGNHIISNKDFIKAVKELVGMDMPDNFKMARISKVATPTWIIKCREKEVLSTLINKGGQASKSH
jgi:hypothetical protein